MVLDRHWQNWLIDYIDQSIVYRKQLRREAIHDDSGGWSDLRPSQVYTLILPIYCALQVSKVIWRQDASLPRCGRAINRVLSKTTADIKTRPASCPRDVRQNMVPLKCPFRWGSGSEMCGRRTRPPADADPQEVLRFADWRGLTRIINWSSALGKLVRWAQWADAIVLTDAL